MSKQKLKQAQERLLKAIARQQTKAKIVQNDARSGSYLEVEYKGSKQTFPLHSSSGGIKRTN